MEFIKLGKAISSCNYFKIGICNLLQYKQHTIIPLRTYAARKGYRELKKKKVKAAVIQKQAWIPHNLRKKDDEKVQVSKRSLEDQRRPAPSDDVWPSRSYAWRVFNFKEAVECHRETHHPTMYNVPYAQITLYIELDMRTARPTRFVEKFKRMAILPNTFKQDDMQDRSILAFCKTPEQKESAQNAGADLVGGVEIIKEIEKGKIVLPDYKFVLAHPTILPELVTIRGLLKKRFPSVKTGTMGPNLADMVSQFKNGVEYSCLRDEKQLDYGWIETTVGRLNMDLSKLEENFITLLKDINTHRPKREGPFITRVVMISPPSVERLKIDLQPFRQFEEVADESSDEDEPVSIKV